jgi:hypothetical protein
MELRVEDGAPSVVARFPRLKSETWGTRFVADQKLRLVVERRRVGSSWVGWAVVRVRVAGGMAETPVPV